MSRQDNKELQSCRAVPYMVITSVSVLARSQLLANAGFWGSETRWEILVRPSGSMYVGLGFLELLAVGKASMMGR